MFGECLIFVSSISALPLNFCNKKQKIKVGTWVAGIARFSYTSTNDNKSKIIFMKVYSIKLQKLTWEEVDWFFCIHLRVMHWE